MFFSKSPIFCFETRSDFSVLLMTDPTYDISFVAWNKYFNWTHSHRDVLHVKSIYFGSQ